MATNAQRSKTARSKTARSTATAQRGHRRRTSQPSAADTTIAEIEARALRPQTPKFEMRHRMALALEFANVGVQEMANELGISRTTVSNYLHGRTKPRRGELIAWALRCGVPFEWLLTGDAGDDDEGPTQAVSPKPWTGYSPGLSQLATVIPLPIPAAG